MQRLEFRAMNCQMLALVDSDDARATEELTHVPTWFDEWENILSRFRANSELNRLNTNAGQASRVSETLWQVIQQSLIAARESNGLVTPTVLDALTQAGYDRSFELLDPHARSGSAAHAPVADWRAIDCDANARAVRLPRGTHLDLGGVAKGWCADQAAQRLSAIAPALVDAGGDIALGGAMSNGDAWQIAIADPFAPARDLEQILVHAGGVATSGRDYRRWQVGGETRHHIIDPRTSRPAETDVLSATVIAPNARQAEVAEKIALILASRAGLDWLNAHSHLAGLLVLENGSVLTSAQFDKSVLRETFITVPGLPVWS